ncbi:ATP-binding cassette, subfamily B, MsbA [Dyella jiangningensis]|uniref:lipid A export permease/ATP-binding protein MsbA n=1 Tax=Dyella sp. AtDHG13 TaxID=1938897 RepID=UPI000882720E|nr:lipid A export permease/ATP-binding protein MsbA [Dyella sp. AtDHG13]PXV60821.1 lipid A export permease/ATP-binding protein MsbA [Dyella sp. AtDHG13]SDK96859.1 ATP-binding cassette, subfamily B, MsbA [Dyella jiangningensis]
MSDGKKKVALWDAKSRQVYKRLLGYSARYWPVILIAIFGFALDGGALALFTSKLQPIMDQLLEKKDPYLIRWMPWWIIGIFAVRGIAILISNYGMGYVARNVVQSMQRDVFAAYLRLPASFFGSEHSGHQVSRITYTSEQVAGASTDALKVAVTESITVIGMIVVMLQKSVYLTTALLILVPAIVLIASAVSRRYRVVSRRIQGMMGSVTGTVDEMIKANREVRIYGGQQQADERFKQVSDRARYLNMKVIATSAISGSSIQTVASLALAGMVFLASRPSQIDHISPGVFIAVLTAMGGMLSSLKRLTNVQSTLQTGISAAENLFGVMDLPAEVDNGTKVLERTRGDLRFDKVGLVYPVGDFQALASIDLHCAPGTVTALVGRSGSGKSSLVSLLPRFNEPSSGRILLDGENYENYTLASLRRQIAWVGQNVVLFDGTVAENIAYGELAGASEQEIIAAAEAAHAMEFIAGLPEGIHSQIGEGGNRLSGGQRQRIAIARAILKNAPILVLDEATSALDTESERLIQQALQGLMRDRTTLVIAHRLSTIEHADQIAVMERGHIVERGTHEQLLALGGQYAALHRMQFHSQPGD